MDAVPLPDAGGGHLSENIAYFARTLRTAGLPVGPGAVLEAIEAVDAAGIGHRADLKATLQAVFVKRREHIALFDQAFRLYFRRRALLEKMMAQLMPIAPSGPDETREKTMRRLAEALFSEREAEVAPQRQLELDSRLSVSDAEVFRQRDFEQMSAAEVAEAKRAIDRLVMPLQAVPVRRFEPAPRGRFIDPRRTLRATLRSGGQSIELRRRQHGRRVPPLVALCDISGSMSQYSRIFLHFLHALMATRTVHAFTFATELTNVTRPLLRHSDPDLALAAAARQVRDWDGGTRIGATLESFNKRWARRVLGQGAIVLLITDGLERRVLDDLPRELSRLQRACRRLIWLNPLLRYEGFEAKAAGIRAMLTHVDEFRSLHSLASVADLCAALADGGSRPPAADPKRFLLPG